MASLINKLNKSFSERESKYNKKLKNKNNMLRNLRQKIYENDSLNPYERESIVKDIDDIILGDRVKYSGRK